MLVCLHPIIQLEVLNYVSLSASNDSGGVVNYVSLSASNDSGGVVKLC